MLSAFKNNAFANGTTEGTTTNFRRKKPFRIKGLSYNLAEAVGFELTEGSHPRRFSRPLH